MKREFTLGRPVQRYSTGAYVVHGILGHWKGTVSAWFSADGELIDAEQVLPHRNCPASRPIKRGGPIWRRLQNHVISIHESK